MEQNGKDEKKARILEALERGMVMIHLDARRPGVRVPAHLQDESHLRLNLSYRFDPPDLTVSDWGVRSSLSFSGSRFQVAVPWSALFAIASHVTHEFWMFAEDLPPELIENQPASDPDAVPTAAAPTPARRPTLSAVDGGRALSPVPEAATASDAGADDVDGEDAAGEGTSKEASTSGAERLRPLAPVPAPAAAESQDGEEPEAPVEPPRPTNRPHLRLVK